MNPTRTSTTRRRQVGAALAAGALLAGLGGVAASAPAQAAPLVCPGDEGSDYGPDPDQLHGTPSRSVGGVPQAGAVRVIPRCGPEAPTLTARSIGFAAVSKYARFGTTVRQVDFDNDQYADLLVSAPGQGGTGAVGIVFGSADGFGEGRAPVRLTAPGLRTGDQFGAAVAVHYNRVFVGAPGVDVGKAKDAGAVFEFRFSATAAMTYLNRWVQGTPSFPGKAERGDRFGEVLSAGGPADLASTDTTGRPFLAIGVPHEDVGTKTDAGSLYVVYGTPFTKSKVLTQATRGVPGTAERGDRFGAAVLATTGDAYDGGAAKGVGGSAVYVGIPGEDVGRARDAGSVQRVAVNAGFKFTVTGGKGQFSKAVPGTAESGDRLGSSLALLSFYGKGERELLAGVPGEDVGRAKDAGAVTSLGFTATTCRYCQTMTQDNGTPETGDLFGTSLTQTFSLSDGDKYYGYRVGAPGEDLGTRTNTGVVETDSNSAVRGTVSGERLGEVPAAVEVG